MEIVKLILIVGVFGGLLSLVSFAGFCAVWAGFRTIIRKDYDLAEIILIPTGIILISGGLLGLVMSLEYWQWFE